MSTPINPISEVTISLPFTITSYGTIQSTTDQNKIWADRVLAVLGTGQHERILYPTFGSGIHSSFYANSEEATTSITQAIESAFSDFLPLLTLVAVNTSFDTAEGILAVEVVYELPNRTTSTVAVGSVSISGNNPPTERR